MRRAEPLFPRDTASSYPATHSTCRALSHQAEDPPSLYFLAMYRRVMVETEIDSGHDSSRNDLISRTNLALRVTAR